MDIESIDNLYMIKFYYHSSRVMLINAELLWLERQGEVDREEEEDNEEDEEERFLLVDSQTDYNVR